MLIYFKFLETKPLSKLNEDTMAKKQKSPSSASEHAPLLDSAATRLVKRIMEEFRYFIEKEQDYLLSMATQNKYVCEIRDTFFTTLDKEHHP